ncbi:restriction endonuclease subunit S [Neisseria sp.]
MNKQQEPRLRFQGFTGEWECRKLGEISTSYSGGTPIVGNAKFYGGTIPFIRSGEIHSSKTELFLTQEGLENSSTKLVKKGDILYALYGATSGEVGRSQIDGAINQAILAIIPKENYKAEFISQWLKINKENIVSLYLQGGQGNLSGEIVKKIEISFPSSKEQTHLGLFFRRLDSQIAESRAVLEKSRQLKKAMLAKMFPADGEKIPKIRFKGFEGEWECRKLGAEVEIVGGGTPDTTNSTYWNGDIDWYSPTEIGEAAYANGSVKKITLLGLQKSSAQILPANRTVLFTSRASIGDMAILTKDGSTNQGFQSFVVGERLDVYFFYTMGFKIKDYALKNASGSTFLEISKNTLSQMEFFAPSLKEQTAIGLFFRQLDETIALQSAEVEKLNQLKKGLLAAMLV